MDDKTTKIVLDRLKHTERYLKSKINIGDGSVIHLKRKSDGRIGYLESIDLKTCRLDIKYPYASLSDPNISWDLNVEFKDYELIK